MCDEQVIASAPMPLYRAYGLTIDSELELPELERAIDDSSAGLAGDARTARAASQSRAPDLTIRFGAVSPDALPGGQRTSPRSCVTATEVWLNIEGVARFLVSGGHSITIDPAPGADAESIRLILLGNCVGVALGQRGLLVLHGNAVQVGDACMCVVGNSGAGKSTTSAGFWRRGHTVLADDVVAVDSDCRVIPGFPRIKLWQESADRLAIDTAALQRIRPGADKFNLPTAAPANTPLPLRWVYVISVHDGPDLRLQPVSGLDRFEPLRSNTYVVRYLKGMALEERHLVACGRLASRIRLVKVSRPREGSTPEAVVDALAADMAAHPADTP